MPRDQEIRQMLAERQKMRRMRLPGEKVESPKFQIIYRMSWHGRDISVQGGEFEKEQDARAKMAKLKPKEGECYRLLDVRGRTKVLVKKGECEAPYRVAHLEPMCGCYPLSGLFEKAVGVADPKRRDIAARRLWLKWVGRLRRAASSAEDLGWTQAAFEPTKGSRALKTVLSQFCKGHVPTPEGKKHESSGRFSALFELVLPNKTMGYPTGLAYTAQPVGSQRGTGVSPAAAGDIDQGRYQNYADGPTIKSRKRRPTSKPIGGGPVVQRAMQSCT